MTVKVTLEDVGRVAELAHLRLTPDETDAMLHDLNAILDYIAQLNELDTGSVVAMSQVSDLGAPESRDALRNDELRPSLRRELVMDQAPETDRVFFKVPKVIEK